MPTKVKSLVSKKLLGKNERREVKVAEKQDLAVAYRLMKSPNKKTARRGLKMIKQHKKKLKGIK